MLKHLYVKNVALISEATIEFDSGLNVLSGETGSGKSVILDSINFILGSKADKTMIRFGENEAFVRAEFIVDCNSEAAEILKEYDIENDGEIIISRKISSDGRGAVKINGCTVTAAMLKNVTQHLVDVHGQSEHFFLLKESNQLKVIDGLLGKEADKVKSSLAEAISEKKLYKSKISSLGGDETERERKLDLLSYQINEIQNADLKPNEFEELKAKQNILLNAEKILSAVSSANSILNGDGGCCDGISTAIREINRISSISDNYNIIVSRLESLATEAEDIAETLSNMKDELSFDESEAQFIEDRLTLIKSLKKKYGADEQAIIEYKDKAQAEYDIIADSAAAIENYNKKLNECDDKIYSLCVELSTLRKKAANDFCNRVESELKTLNIPNARFSVKFNEFDKSSAKLSSENGCDEICFEFSANKGEPLKPLSKVISGGEMSRFMLAIKTQLKYLNGISTYIFDEIDAGISGYTAGTVANKFSNIAQSTQILAVSHLPQVCAASDIQFLIYKEEENGKTQTKVKRLSESQKIDELVRLTGSIDSESARQHALELIKIFKNV